MARPFLTARWSNLCLLTYPVPPAALEGRLPGGLELDTRDGQAFVSLVAFDFRDARVLGVPWPSYRNFAGARFQSVPAEQKVPRSGFAEINLRFYVRQGADRGVVFIREFIPSRLAAWVARTLYHEPYLAAPTASAVHQDPHSLTAEYLLVWRERTHSVSVTGRKPGNVPGPDTVEHFFKEHHWGFGTDRKGRLIRYEVQHPLWEVYPVASFQVEFDFGLVYGPEWAFLNGARPFSTILAAGSPIAVYPKGRPAFRRLAGPP
ncbi:MAG TPA: DUF2071 domain-containing protein [Gemmataceae bacterium]|jgi:hypothetical protein|nr:DUF2071 domain-containing protein [Gemmataceae bacterium]